VSKQDKRIARGKEADSIIEEIVRDAFARLRLEPPAIRGTLLGTEYASDEPSKTYDQRLARCFELATYAVAFGAAPAGSTLVHGSWHGPGAPERIPHAWVLLGKGRFVWEPIRGRVYRRVEFDRWTDADYETEYSLGEVRRHIAASGHYGPWHRPVVRLEDRA